ncbi:MAG: hemerythrin domain-containing protein [Burkholderiales bacterium]|nr:hemerythrin domain-containing protein [Burkholderiales bacterium]
MNAALATTAPGPAADPPEPIAGFSRCHEGILQHLSSLAALPALAEAVARARAVAAETQRFFRAVVYEHHLEEERELFPAVLASATPGAEHDQVRAIVDQLTQEHRDVEAAFEAIEPSLKRLAKGQDAALAGAELAARVRSLVTRYEEHAHYEENELLPLAERILARNGNHMAALGLSLHLRHALPEVLARYGARF